MLREKIDSLVIGDCFFDIIVKLYNVKRSMQIGGAVGTSGIQVFPGGTGNVAAVLSRLGGKAAFCGVVGSDPLGNLYMDDLKANSVLPIIAKRGRHTGLSLVLLSSGGERSFLVSRGANDYLTEEQVRVALKLYDPKVVFISGYSLTKKWMERIILSSLKLANSNNSKVVFDCTPFNLVVRKQRLFTKIISKSYWTCINIKEAESLAGTQDLKEIISYLKSASGISTLKLGPYGCLLITQEKVKKFRTRKVNVMNTNGAGDCFAGGIIYGISKNITLDKMCRLGVALGTLNVQYQGARLPSSKDLSQYVAKYAS